MSQETAVVVVGDELVAAKGDPSAQGWLGRVMARTPGKVTAFPLAVPAETTTALVSRWEPEAERRFLPETAHRLVVAIGWSDLDAGISVPRARLNLANILDRARSLGVRTMVVGPPPRRREEESAITAYSTAFAEVASRRDAPYVDLVSALANHEQWLADMVNSGHTWPAQHGYGLIAWMVQHTGWDQFLA
ncbi:MAG: GDSL-type esterase/lipase family protein [Promicromonosporaceae bacterium]|nr:GDSL-type esterase/lipase family protein [Promicromonosporaceae bacterium]